MKEAAVGVSGLHSVSQQTNKAVIETFPLVDPLTHPPTHPTASQ